MTSVAEGYPAEPFPPLADLEADADLLPPPEDELAFVNQSAGRQRKIVRWIGSSLALGLVALLFVPLSGDAQGGDSTFRLLVLGILAMSSIAVIERPALALEVVKRLWPMGVLLLWLLVTSRWASYPDISVRRGLAYVLMFAIAISLAVSFDNAADVFAPLLRGLGAVFIVNWVSAHTEAPIDAAMGVTGLYAQKNGAGALALYVVIVATCATLFHRRLEWKTLCLGLTVLAWGFLLATHAKTSLATAALLTAGLPFIGRFLLQPLPRKTLVLSALALVLGSAVFTQYVLGITWERIGTAVFGDLTFTNRTPIWDALYPEIARHPWTGAGFGSFWATGQLLNPISSASPDAFFMSPDIINEAHNGYIDITLQAGYVGLFLVIIVLLRAVYAACCVVGTHNASREDRLACTMLLCMLVALVISNFTESQIFSPSNPIGYLFVIIAVQAERWYVHLRLRPASGGFGVSGVENRVEQADRAKALFN